MRDIRGKFRHGCSRQRNVFLRRVNQATKINQAVQDIVPGSTVRLPLWRRANEPGIWTNRGESCSTKVPLPNFHYDSFPSFLASQVCSRYDWKSCWNWSLVIFERAHASITRIRLAKKLQTRIDMYFYFGFDR